MPNTEKKTISALEALRLSMTEKGQLDRPFEKVPLEILQLDWEKAKGLQVEPETFDHDAAWKLICQIGFSKAAVLPLIDPAIVEIIDRLLDLPVLPLSSCSGHPWGARPWVTVIFLKPVFGERFVAGLKALAKKRQVSVNVNTYISRQIGAFGPRLSLDLCFQFGLPVTISIDANSAREALSFWSVFSATLHSFDGKGCSEIDKAKFEFRVADDDRPEYLREIWNSLWWGETV